MAFPSAPGYGNLPLGNFSPTIFSKDVIGLLKNKAVVDEVTNTAFAGEIADYGDSVRIIKQPLVTTTTYTRGMKLTSQDLNDEDTTLTVDQGLVYQFTLDDVERKQSHVSFADMAVDSAAYSLLQSYEQNIFAAMDAAATTSAGTGTAASPVAIGYQSTDAFTPYNLLNRLNRLLNEGRVPPEGRFIVASPRFYEELAAEDGKLVEAQVTGEGKSMARDPRIAMRPLAGFTLYMSNNAPTDANGNAIILAGSKSATSVAKNIVQSEVIRSPDSFSDVYRGLMIYGRKVLRPEMLYSAHVTY
jgi:hypothetical protein